MDQFRNRDRILLSIRIIQKIQIPVFSISFTGLAEFVLYIVTPETATSREKRSDECQVWVRESIS